MTENIQRRLPSSTILKIRPPPSETPIPQQRYENFQPLWPSHLSAQNFSQPQFKQNYLEKE
jgi:hypothetical protein